MTSPRDGYRVPSTARLLLGGALVMGLGATLVLVFSDDSRFLKLGIVAALWAALMGVFLAARFRRQVADRADNAADKQAIYELELEREIAARREYELELEAEAKRKVEEESRQDIDALRTELGALRETLQSLLGGEVLVERLALQATRMRSISEDSPQLVARQTQAKRLTASAREQVVVPAEPQTELMDRVVDRAPTRRPPTQRPPQQRPPREPERQVRPPQRVDPAEQGSGWWEPVIPPGQSAQRQETFNRPDPTWERGRPPRPPKAPQPSQPLPRPVEADPATRVQPAIRPQEPATRVQAPIEVPTRVHAPVGSTGRPTVAAEPASRIQVPAEPRPVEPSPIEVAARAAVEPPAEPAVRVQDLIEPPGRVRQPIVEPLPPPPPVEQGGRRRAPEPSAEDTGGGRRRRPENAPSWQESLQDRSTGNTGSHAKPAPPAEPTGSHAEGKSVSELLAANGVAESPRRRRRRDD